MEDEAIKLPPLPEDWRGMFGYRMVTWEEAQEYARQAVLAERERCAKITRGFATCGCNGAHGRCNEDDAPLAIAKAIRSGHSITETARPEE